MFFKKKEDNTVKLTLAIRDAKKSKEENDRLIVSLKEKHAQVDSLIEKLRNAVNRLTNDENN